MKEKLADINLFLFDMDGTIYLGGQVFDFTVELLSKIKKAGKHYMFMTNNSSKGVEDYIKKLAGMGISAEYDEFITSSQATAHYLKQNHRNAKFYVCGTESFKRELISNGLYVTEDADECTCVIMGFDTELTFKKLDDVCRILSTRDVPYIASHPDWVCPTEYGSVPDCGCVCEMVYTATGKRPLIIGKPEPLMPLLAMEKTNTPKENTAVIGDRIYTDIKSGINAGAVSVLVLSGETTTEDLVNSEDKPDIVLESAAEIIHYL